MKRKLQCILVDDDPEIHNLFKKYLKDSEHVEIIEYYQDPQEFIKANKTPDLVFTDIVMPHIDGFTLAAMIKPIPVILFTGMTDRFRDLLSAIDVIDAFPKPIVKERLLEAIKKACVLISPTKKEEKFALFHTNEGEVNILLTDILLVKTVKNSHRNIEVYLKDGRKLTLKRYSLEYIQQVAEFLLQPNRAELVSPEAIDIIQHSSIKLRGINNDGKVVYSCLGVGYRKNFLSRISSI